MDFDDIIHSIFGTTSSAQLSRMPPQQQQQQLMTIPATTPDNSKIYMRPPVGGETTDPRAPPWQPPALPASQQPMQPLPGAGIYTSGNHAMGDAANYDARAFGRAANEFGQGHYASAAGNAVAGAALAVPSAILDVAQAGFNNLQSMASPVVHAVRSALPAAQEFARGITGAAPPVTPMMPEFNTARQAIQSQPQSQPQPFATPMTNGDALTSAAAHFTGSPQSPDGAFASSMRTEGNSYAGTPDYYTSGIPGAVPPSNKGYVPAGATGGYGNTGGVGDVGSAANNFANDLVQMRHQGFQDLHYPGLPANPVRDAEAKFKAAHPDYKKMNAMEYINLFNKENPNIDAWRTPNSADVAARAADNPAAYSPSSPTVGNYLQGIHELVDQKDKGYLYAPGGRDAAEEFRMDYLKHNPRTFQEMGALMPNFARQQEISKGHSDMWVEQMYRQRAADNAVPGSAFAPIEKLRPLDPNNPLPDLGQYHQQKRAPAVWESQEPEPVTDQSAEQFGDRPSGSHSYVDENGRPMGQAFYTGGQTPLPQRDAEGNILPEQMRSPANGGWYQKGMEPGLTSEGKIVPPGKIYPDQSYIYFPGSGKVQGAPAAKPQAWVPPKHEASDFSYSRGGGEHRIGVWELKPEVRAADKQAEAAWNAQKQGAPQGAPQGVQPVGGMPAPATDPKEAFLNSLTDAQRAYLKTGKARHSDVVDMIKQNAQLELQRANPINQMKREWAEHKTGLAQIVAQYGISVDDKGNVNIPPETQKQLSPADLATLVLRAKEHHYKAEALSGAMNQTNALQGFGW